jgi:hypothetical protein
MYKLDNNAWPIHDHTPRQHHWITSPIAYLSTSIQDIFAQSAKAREDSKYIYHHGLYHLEPSFYWFYQWGPTVRSDPDYFANSRNAAFFVTSYGPDQDFDQDLKDGAVYSSSNGLASNGDILAAVPGDGREGYPYTEGIAIFDY